MYQSGVQKNSVSHSHLFRQNPFFFEISVVIYMYNILLFRSLCRYIQLHCFKYMYMQITVPSQLSSYRSSHYFLLVCGKFSQQLFLYFYLFFIRQVQLQMTFYVTCLFLYVYSTFAFFFLKSLLLSLRLDSTSTTSVPKSL